MLTHQERTQLAYDLSDRMVAAYPIVLAGVYGSTARGTDTPWSDLEMWFVVQDDCSAQGQHFLYRGISAGYRVYRKRDLEDILSRPSWRWPFHMGVLSALQVLHGNPGQLRAWIAIGQTVPPAKFRAFLEAQLPEMVFESYGRIHSCTVRSDLGSISYAVNEVLFEMQAALCLLNRRWVTLDYLAGLRQTFDFKLLPENFAGLVSELLAATSFERIVPLADRLLESFLRLLQAEGIVLRNHLAVDEVAI